MQSSEKQDVLQADELQADVLLSVNRSPLANDLPNTRLYTDVCSIIEQGRKEAYASVNHKMIETYWNIGRRIVEEEQNGEVRAEYGVQIIAQLSEQLTHQYGKEFSKRNLAYFRQFYLTISDIRILIPRIKKMSVLDDYILFVEFDDGYKVLYDVKDDIKTLPSFRALVDVYGLFKQAQLDTSRTCVYWNDKIDLASESIYE